MFISEIFASGFRCFDFDNALVLKLRRGLNILVGPNDMGKTAIIDAPRYVLWIRGDDFVRLDANDFHVQSAGHRASELLIRCSFVRDSVHAVDFRSSREDEIRRCGVAIAGVSLPDQGVAVPKRGLAQRLAAFPSRPSPISSHNPSMRLPSRNFPLAMVGINP